MFKTVKYNFVLLHVSILHVSAIMGHHQARISIKSTNMHACKQSVSSQILKPESNNL